MKKKWMISLLLCCFLALFAFGCGTGENAADPQAGASQEESAEPSGETLQDEPQGTQDLPDVQEPAVYTARVVLYYANDEYIETGRSDLPRLLPYEADIKYTAEEGPLKAMLEELKSVPADAEGMSTLVPEDAVFLDVRVDWADGEVVYSDNGEPDGDQMVIFVDVASEGLAGGSLTEEMFIDQIVETLFAGGCDNGGFLAGQYGSPQKVQFLVDGEKAETLMGHFDAMEPFESTLEN